MNIQPQLIALCIKRDRRAEYELYKQTYSYLMSICMRYAKDKDMASYRPEVPFKAWIRRIMINTLIDEYRKNRKERENMTYVEDYFDNSDFSDVNEALSRINCKYIFEQVNKLPEATKKVFNLFAIDGYSHKEIGEMLAISEGTSKWHLNAARQKLKEYIETSMLTKI